MQPVIANLNEAAQAWCRRHGGLAINHMLVVKTSLAQSSPSAVEEIYRLLRASTAAAMTTDAPDPIQFGIENIRRSLELIIDYSAQQRLIPRRFEVDELFDDVTRHLS